VSASCRLRAALCTWKSEVLGHASVAITKDVYGHLVESDKWAAAEAMSAALFDVGELERRL
jgi:hypothetical protein